MFEDSDLICKATRNQYITQNQNGCVFFAIDGCVFVCNRNYLIQNELLICDRKYDRLIWDERSWKLEL